MLSDVFIPIWIKYVVLINYYRQFAQTNKPPLDSQLLAVNTQ